ncbi:hypothetical protein JTE90_005649 [Oedothorax gibbosus]|uniref:Extracellular serine/threonine protein kinase four-jointed n=1 Tax=Oedothorax gibbosus TaxID=931172 RepID=A0AAV6UHD1_9ARAC|nr:hypothetical protein JTE90_005649 [Oedothorax gibbosus]
MKSTTKEGVIPCSRGDSRLNAILAFAAGILIGVPLTLGLLWAHDEYYRNKANGLPDPFLPVPRAEMDSRRSGPVQNSSSPLPLVASLLVRKTKSSSFTVPNSLFATQPTPAAEQGAPAAKKFRFEDIAEGVYWSPLAEKQVPRGFDDDDLRLWKRLLNNTEVRGLEEGCGRMQNRLLTLAGGGKSCCRYRHNNDQIQGEIFSFYLGRHLGIRNLVPSSLALVDSRARRWSAAAPQIALARWSPERPVVLTQFVEDLQPAFIPPQFRTKSRRRLHPIRQDLGNLTADQVSQLVQWSDLVLFDYLTANLDRVVNNLFNERWNPEMMRQPTHNLAKTRSGLLLFLDNESGLLHGYRLLEKYEHFHRTLLDALCVFRRDTAAVVERLHASGDVEHVLRDAFHGLDPGMRDWLPFLPERSLRTLRKRITHVAEHIRTCKARFAFQESAVLQTPLNIPHSNSKKETHVPCHNLGTSGLFSLQQGASNLSEELKNHLMHQSEMAPELTPTAEQRKRKASTGRLPYALL